MGPTSFWPTSANVVIQRKESGYSWLDICGSDKSWTLAAFSFETDGYMDPRKINKTLTRASTAAP
jgi:hypothetical protein